VEEEVDVEALDAAVTAGDALGVVAVAVVDVAVAVAVGVP
jgi:hypothetical protein